MSGGSVGKVALRYLCNNNDDNNNNENIEDYDNNKSFYEDKIQTAKFYFKRVLPRAENHFKTASTGSDYIMNFKFN